MAVLNFIHEPFVISLGQDRINGFGLFILNGHKKRFIYVAIKQMMNATDFFFRRDFDRQIRIKQFR